MPAVGRKVSEVRKYFSVAPSTGKTKHQTYECVFCKWTTTLNASRMRLHIEKCKDCPTKVKDKFKPTHTAPLTTDKSECGSAATVLQNLEDHANRATTSKAVDKKMINNETCSDTGLSKFVDRMTRERQSEAEGLLARAIYSSGTPLAVLDNSHWKTFFRNLRPSFEIPSRWMLSGPLLDAEHDAVAVRVKTAINEADCLGVACDGWSNLRNESIVNFIVTTPKPVLFKTMTTGEERHTGEYIAKVVNEVIEEIGAERVLGVCTDNAANMTKALRIVERTPGHEHITGYGCIAHVLNLLMNDIATLPTVNKLVDEAKDIVKEIKLSHLLSANLRRKQRATVVLNKGKGKGKGKGKEKGKCESTTSHSTQPCTGSDGPANLANIKSLKLPVPTRWGSTVVCLRSLLENRFPVMAMAVDETMMHKVPKRSKALILNDGFWSRLSRIIDVLEPIAHATEKIESDVPRISQAVEIFAEIDECLQSSLPQSPLSGEEETQAREYVSNRREFCIGALHKAANLLDPALEGKHLSEDDVTEAIEYICHISQQFDSVDEEEVLQDLANFRSKDGLWRKDIIWKCAQKVSPSTWWKGICSSRRHLSFIASRILQLPATSASVERSFSTYGNIHSAKRNRLTAERAGKLVYISHNLRLFDSSSDSTKAGHDEHHKFTQERVNNEPPLPVPPAACNLPAIDEVHMADELQQLESECECKSISSSSNSDDQNYISDECDFDYDNDNDFGDRENARQSDDEMFLSMTVENCE